MNNTFWHNPTMDILKSSLDTASLRHKTISNNLANINTPKYKRHLVNFEAQLAKYIQKENSIPLKKTNELHFSREKINHLEIKPFVEEDKRTSQRIDGNNVDMDLELAMLAANTVKFNVLSQTINKKYSMLRSVIQGGR